MQFFSYRFCPLYYAYCMTLLNMLIICFGLSCRILLLRFVPASLSGRIFIPVSSDMSQITPELKRKEDYLMQRKKFKTTLFKSCFC